MPMPGYVFKDGQPIPDDEQQQVLESPQAQHGTVEIASPTSTSNSSSAEIFTPSSSTVGEPSDSHAIAKADHEEQGAVQMHDGRGEVKDMGWRAAPEHVPAPLVGGLPNDELWTLVRRFNKQLYHVKATNAPLLAGLDLNIVDEDEFSPDKLRSNVERLYMTVIIGCMGFGKHIARIRSWREPRRTAAFGAAYALAWIFDLLVPLFMITIITLIVYPPSRPYLFPPAPLALVNSKTGGVQSPQAGVLGSHDSATGAPENHKGEAVEQEAHNFVSGIGSIALSSAAGKSENSDPESDPVNDSVPDPTALATAGAEAKVNAQGGNASIKHDKTKQPMEEAMWKQMRPIMHVIGDICDGWERFGNALSPTKPFPQLRPRLTLASVFAPLLAVSLVLPADVFVKIVMAGAGFGFFGDPLIWRGLALLNQRIPGWQKLIELRNSVLKGIPTNAQLTITLLRIGEANKAPLPPPPRSDQPPSSKPASINGDDLPLDTDHAELQSAIHKSDEDRQAEHEATKKHEDKHRHGHKILGFFKGTTNVGVGTKFGVDKARAKVLGSEAAKNHLGVLPKTLETHSSGPVDFKARYKGRKGWVFITTDTPIPCVSFSYSSTDATGELPEKADTIWSVAIEDIQELKKVGGLGWKAKIVVGWATDKTVADGLELSDRAGHKIKITAIPLREELFNRLASMGSQKWESW